MEPKLKIDIFQQLYKRLKTPFPPINYLILGWLIGIEFHYIELKIKQTLDEAIEDFKKEHHPEVVKAAIKEHEDGSMSIGEID